MSGNWAPGVMPFNNPGYPDAMPHTFGSQIPPDKLKQLVQYLSGNAK